MKYVKGGEGGLGRRRERHGVHVYQLERTVGRRDRQTDGQSGREGKRNEL